MQLLANVRNVLISVVNYKGHQYSDRGLLIREHGSIKLLGCSWLKYAGVQVYTQVYTVRILIIGLIEESENIQTYLLSEQDGIRT